MHAVLLLNPKALCKTETRENSSTPLKSCSETSDFGKGSASTTSPSTNSDECHAYLGYLLKASDNELGLTATFLLKSMKLKASEQISLESFTKLAEQVKWVSSTSR